MKRNRVVLVLLALLLISLPVFAGGAQEEPAAETEDSVFKVAFVYIGIPGDLGWTFEHDRGRLAAVEALGDNIETAYVENVPEGPDATRVIRQFAQKGFDMIWTTSFGYMDPTLEVAQEYPDVIFEHCSGYKTADNMANYFGRIYQARYLSGMVAGSATETNTIGYVGAFPIPEVVRGINAFTLGVQKTNPDAVVKVVWTNTWFDPVKEREAAVALLDAGADVIAQHQDTTEPQKAAQGERPLVDRIPLRHGRFCRRLRTRKRDVGIRSLLYRENQGGHGRQLERPELLGRTRRRRSQTF